MSFNLISQYACNSMSSPQCLYVVTAYSSLLVAIPYLSVYILVYICKSISLSQRQYVFDVILYLSVHDDGFIARSIIMYACCNVRRSLYICINSITQLSVNLYTPVSLRFTFMFHLVIQNRPLTVIIACYQI